MSWLTTLLVWFENPDVQEVCLHGVRSTHVLCAGYSYHADPLFTEAQLMQEAVQDFVFAQNKRLDPYCPSAGGSYASGYRWHAVLAPMSRDPVVFLLRRHRFSTLQLSDFAWHPEVSMQAVTNTVMDGQYSLLIGGPTGAGKTSFLTALLRHCAMEERVVVIEDLEEVPLLSPSWLSLLAREEDIEGRGAWDLFELADEALRLRPDRMVLGEMRSPASLVFFATRHWGHKGSMATIHVHGHEALWDRVIDLESRFQNKRGMPLCWNDVFCVTLKRGDPPIVESFVRMRELQLRSLA
jgi:pilus assembly protein CpaF